MLLLTAADRHERTWARVKAVSGMRMRDGNQISVGHRELGSREGCAAFGII